MFKTQGVLDLVNDALPIVPHPYTEDVIEDVALVIEADPTLKARYDDLCLALRGWVVNNWIGQHIKNTVNMKSIRQVVAHRSTLIGSYTKLEQ